MKSLIRTLVLCIGIIFIGALIWGLLFFFKKAPEVVTPEVAPQLVRAQLVEKGATQIDVRTQGTVRPRSEIQLMAEVSGRILWVAPAFADGGFFEKDQELLRIDPADWQIAVTRAKAQVAQAEVRVTQEVAEAELARKEWAQLGTGEANPLTLREPQLAEARANLAAAEANLQKAELDLRRCVVRAPFAGRIKRRLVDRGQYVGMATPVAEVFALDLVEVRLPVHDRDLFYLDLDLARLGRDGQVGPKVEFSARFAQTDVRWQGRIVRAAGEVDPRTRMVQLIAQVKNPFGLGNGGDHPPLSPNLFVQARIEGRAFTDVVKVPRSAVLQGRKVLIIDQEDRLAEREIEVLHRSRDEITVGKGLTDGERVCLSVVSTFYPGMKVRVEGAEQDQDEAEAPK